MKTLELIPGAGPTRKHIRLITAAPDLLEALIEARDWLLPEATECLERINAAIAKATEPSYERT